MPVVFSSIIKLLLLNSDVIVVVILFLEPTGKSEYKIYNYLTIFELPCIYNTKLCYIIRIYRHYLLPL